MEMPVSYLIRLVVAAVAVFGALALGHCARSEVNAHDERELVEFFEAIRYSPPDAEAMERALQGLERMAESNVLVCVEIAHGALQPEGPVQGLWAGRLWMAGPCHDRLPEVLQIMRPYKTRAELIRCLDDHQIQRNPELIRDLLQSPSIEERVATWALVAARGDDALVSAIAPSVESVKDPFDQTIDSGHGSKWWVEIIPFIVDQSDRKAIRADTRRAIQRAGCRWVVLAEQRSRPEDLGTSPPDLSLLKGALCDRPR